MFNCFSRDFNNAKSAFAPQNQPLYDCSDKLFIAFYNVENLYDAIDDPIVDDAEFLPEGKHHWTETSYNIKIANIARVIKEMNHGIGPDILGLAEVENLSVMQRLVNNPEIKNLDYKIVHHESPDIRGIDVAMIYKSNCFHLIDTHSFKVNIKYDQKPTRDIVLVKGMDSNHDTLFIFLNHWPSRKGGKRESEPLRRTAAQILRGAVDSITAFNPDAKLIIMGDFNDNPSDDVITKTLKASAKPDTSERNSLFDAANNFDWKAGEGSEFYHGEWSRFIQIILSTSLIKKQLLPNGEFNDIHIFNPEWLLSEDEAYQQMIPYRTFEKGKPIGYSDHLPVYIELKL